MQHEAALGLDRTAAHDLDHAARDGSWITSAAGMTLSFTNRSEKLMFAPDG